MAHGVPGEWVVPPIHPTGGPHAPPPPYPARLRPPTALDPVGRRRAGTDRLLRGPAPHRPGPVPAVGRHPRAGRLGPRPPGHRVRTRDRPQGDRRLPPRGPARPRTPDRRRAAPPPAP